ncbi:MAG: hypothetical protein HPY90_13220 [Syntrophothermus sp.]|uniref:PilN domain-containing protein n=1 Tax=Syntrophothermus sp. TaxID=2736299 RepID=UPI00257B0064|nr:hypothetical protein [Syntrophothermus sp.]NSW84209.1 hypothetical protein [Syntrophothermus sp.]
MYRVNLLPPKLQREGNIDFRRLFAVAGITFVSGAVVGGYGLFLGIYFGLKAELAATKQQIATLHPLALQAEKIQAERKGLEAAMREYEAILAERRTWWPMLADLNKIAPADLWLTGLDLSYVPGSEQDKGAGPGGTSSEKQAQDALPGRPNTLILRGSSRSLSSIGIFQYRLTRGGCFRQVELRRVAPGSGGISFEIAAHLEEG